MTVKLSPDLSKLVPLLAAHEREFLAIQHDYIK